MGDGKATNHVARKLWLPLPGLALPVRVTMDADTELDGLAWTVLRLMQIIDRETEAPRPRRGDELARKLGLEGARDLVDVALMELQDRSLIEPVEEGSEVYQLVTENVEEPRGATVHAAWAFILPGSTPQILPRLWFGDELPGHKKRSEILARDFNEEHRQYFESFVWKTGLGNDQEVSRLLQSLVRRSELRLCGGDDRDGKDDDEEELSLPLDLATNRQPSNTNIRSIEIDHIARQSGHSFEWTTLWTHVDFLPRIAAPAIAVYHDPDIAPKNEFGLRPVNDSLADWLTGNQFLRPLSESVQGQAEALKKEFSLVLKSAGIDSEAELERAVDEHRDRLRDQTGLSVPAQGQEILQRKLHAKYRDAWRWLYISRQRPDRYVRVARDSYAHAVEALTQALRDQSLAQLEGWREAWSQWETKAKRKQFVKDRKNSGWRNDRLGMCRIEPGELGPSLGFLKSNTNKLKKIDDLSRSIENADGLGAGASITLWLLPIFLLDDDGAKQYARPLRYALNREPVIFEYLNDLLQMRNQVFHDRGEDVELLEEVDRKLYKVWTAIEAGYGEERELGS